MANTYYDSQLTAAEIEAALEAIDGVIVPANNGKVLAINNGKIEARSVQWGGGEPVLEPLSVTANGDYTPEAGVDGFDEVHVSVQNSYTASDEGKVVSNGALVAQTARVSQITENGTYDTTLNNEVTVNVSGGGSAVIQSLSVTQNGTYNPPSGVDGYAPVTVNVSGGGGGGIDLTYLPNSDSSKVVASADYTMLEGNCAGTFSVPLYSGSSTQIELTVQDNAIQLPIGTVLCKSVGVPNRDMTCYCVTKYLGTTTAETMCMAAAYAFSGGNCPSFYSSNGTKIQQAVYGSYNPEIVGENYKEYHVYAFSLNQTTKKARFYFDGVFSTELTFYNSGSVLSIGRAAPDSSNYDGFYAFKYGGVVTEVESDATITANMQTIMTKLGMT